MLTKTQFHLTGCPFCAGRIDATVKDDGQEHRFYLRHAPGCTHPEYLGKPTHLWWRTDWKREGRPTFFPLKPEERERLAATTHAALKKFDLVAAAAPEGAP